MENANLKNTNAFSFRYSGVLKEILGDYYEDVKAFFYKYIQDEKYEYKIFMSRRCFVLYQLFASVLLEENKEIDFHNQLIITDKGIIHYRKELQAAKSILLIDDVLIYGRTIEKIYKKLRQWASQAVIDVAVYIKNNGELCITDKELSDNLRFRFEEETRDWREFSDKLVYCIYAANMPYTSFVNSYYNYVTEKDKEKLDRIFFKWDNFEVTNQFQKKYNLFSFIFFPGDMKEKYPLFHAISKKCCIRTYYNSNLKKFLLIPYVFLIDINILQLSRLCEKCGELMPEFKEALLFDTDADIEISDLAAYKGRLLTCIFSYIYGNLLFYEAGIDVTGWMDDRDTILKTFDGQITKKLFELSIDRMKLIASSEAFSEIISDEAAIQTWHTDEEIVNFPTDSDIQNMIYTYFRMEGDKDEELAKKKKGRMKGSTTKAILDFCKKHLSEQKREEEIYACLINAWDTGYASFDWSVSDDHKYLAGFNIAGEQSFRQIIEKYTRYFHDIAFIYNKIWEKALRGEKISIKELLYEKVKLYCDAVSAPEEFKVYIKNNQKDLRKFMVKDILNSNVYDVSEDHVNKWLAFCDKNF